MNDGGENYALARVAIGAKQSIPLTKEEYNEIVQERGALSSIASFEEKFLSICEAYKAVEQAIFNIALDHLIYTNIDAPKIHGTGAVFARPAMHLLTVVRLYLDTVETHATEISDGHIPEGTAKAILSKHYDGSLEYRVMEAVRNHAQHRAFPVHGGSLGGGWNKDRTINSYGVSFYFKSKKVLEDGKFKKSVLEEIEKAGGEIELKRCVRRYFSEICDIHTELRELFVPYRHGAIKMMRYWREKWGALPSEHHDPGLLGVAAWKFNGQVVDQDAEHAYIDPQVDEYREALEQQTTGLKNMWRRRVEMYRDDPPEPRDEDD